MRVTIEHREEASGVTRAKRHYFVDCTVEFSEEEKAVIKARDLYSHWISAEPAHPPESGGRFLSTVAMRAFGPLVIGIGVVVAIISSFNGWGEGPATFLIFGGIFMVVGGFLRERKAGKKGQLQQISLRRLLNNPHFSIYAADPAAAKLVDAELRKQLSNLKIIISESAEISAKQTFEL